MLEKLCVKRYVTRIDGFRGFSFISFCDVLELIERCDVFLAEAVRCSFSQLTISQHLIVSSDFLELLNDGEFCAF